MEGDRQVRLNGRIGWLAAGQVDRGRGVDGNDRDERVVRSLDELDGRADRFPQHAPDTGSQERVDHHAGLLDSLSQDRQVTHRGGMHPADVRLGTQAIPIPGSARTRRAWAVRDEHDDHWQAESPEPTRRDKPITAVVAWPAQDEDGTRTEAPLVLRDRTDRCRHCGPGVFHEPTARDAQRLGPAVRADHRLGAHRRAVSIGSPASDEFGQRRVEQGRIVGRQGRKRVEHVGRLERRLVALRLADERPVDERSRWSLPSGGSPADGRRRYRAGAFHVGKPSVPGDSVAVRGVPGDGVPADGVPVRTVPAPRLVAFPKAQGRGESKCAGQRRALVGRLGYALLIDAPTTDRRCTDSAHSWEEHTTLVLPVFGLALLEIWAAVPAGIALGLPPLVVWLVTVSGSLLSVIVVGTTGGALRDRLVRGRLGGGVPRTGRLYRIWVRHGVPGWGLVSPLLMAPPMGTAVALLLGAPRRRLLLWMAAGVVLWTSILVLAGTIGLGVVHLILGPARP